MSLPAVSALGPLPFELIVSDGKPLEDSLHLVQMSLLTHLIGRAMAEQGRTDFFTAANTFVYYSVQQAQEVFREVTQNLPERAFRGPDVYFVDDVDPRDRSHWVAWEENGRLPDVIFELLSRSTKHKTGRRRKTSTPGSSARQSTTCTTGNAGRWKATAWRPGASTAR
jgi:Uma2 family endonuclease